MPLPNAEKTSKRIYPIMQGKTLEEIASGENPTIDNTAKVISVEELNEARRAEQEPRRVDLSPEGRKSFRRGEMKPAGLKRNPEGVT